MVTRLEHKILLWASTAGNDINHSPNRKEFNDTVKKILGKEAHQVVLCLWKEGYIKLGYLGIVTISGKGCMKMVESIEDEKEEINDVSI
jgi:hypothetical protein